MTPYERLVFSVPTTPCASLLCKGCKRRKHVKQPLLTIEERLIKSSHVYNEYLQKCVLVFLGSRKNSPVLQRVSRDIVVELAKWWWNTCKKKPDLIAC